MALIPSDVGISLRSQTDSPLAPVNPLKEIPADLPQLQAGQAFTARIQEVLPENTYRALVAGKSITLALPEGAQAGDVLELVVVDKTPRLILARQADGGTQADSKGDALYPHATFSPAARLISQLLPQEGEQIPSVPLNRGTPLVAPADIPDGDLAAHLASRLSQSVAQSGLFYEAHQAQWVMGRVSTEQLLAEPQNQGKAASPAGKSVGNSGVSGDSSLAPFAAAKGETSATAATGRTTDPAQVAQSQTTIPESLRPLVQQQLDAASTQRLAWHGEVWPNQTMEWEIHRDPRQASAEESDALPWTTRMTLTTPHLGRVEASLSLSGTTLNIALTAPSESTSDTLKSRSSELAGALEAAGIKVRGLQVQHGTE